MAYFTSIRTNTTESVTIIQDFLGGVFTNYIKTTYQLEEIISVKQSGIDVSYIIEDVDGDGLLEIMVGELTGVCSIQYKITDVIDTYRESKEITIFSSGQPNNYFETTNFPVLTVNSPSSGTIEGSYKNVVRVGDISGKITTDYDYDSGEINSIAKEVEKITKESDELRSSISNQISNQSNVQDEFNIDDKYVSLYNRAYDFIVNLPNELGYIGEETTQIGAWTYDGGELTYLYSSGNQTNYDSILTSQILSNQKVISTYSILGEYYQDKITSTEITVTSSALEVSDFYAIDKVSDGFTGGSYSFQSDNVNPVSVYLELPDFNYLTKIRINATPNEEVETITSILLCDDLAETNPIELLSESKVVSNQFVDFFCLQEWGINDENGNSLVYLPKKKVVKVTISNPKQTNVWVNEIEVYYPNFTEEDQDFYDSTWNIYNQNVFYIDETFGPNTGLDEVPPIGRATWWNTRKTLTDQRVQDIESFLEYFGNVDIKEQVESEGDLDYTNYQKATWRLKYDETKNKLNLTNDSINTSAKTVVDNNDKLIDYERYI